MIKDSTASDMVQHAQALSRRCQQALEEILHGQGEIIQGAVLADLVSLWLAGHVDVNEIGKAHKPNTEKLRKALLRQLVATVRMLVPESEKEIMARVEPQGRA